MKRSASETGLRRIYLSGQIFRHELCSQKKKIHHIHGGMTHPRCIMGFLDGWVLMRSDEDSVRDRSLDDLPSIAGSIGSSGMSLPCQKKKKKQNKTKANASSSLTSCSWRLRVVYLLASNSLRTCLLT